MRVIGLTGGIGMGKSTAAAAFRRAHVRVFDADAAVHALQAPGGRALPAIAAAFPGTVGRDEAGRQVLHRAALRALVLADSDALRRLEAIIHPLVRAAERAFLAQARRAGARVCVLDIPLLLEQGGRASLPGRPNLRGRVDIVVVVSAPRDIQIRRVVRRGRMDRAQIEAVIARQMPDAQKRRLADHVVRTGLSRHHGWRAVRRLTLELLA